MADDRGRPGPVRAITAVALAVTCAFAVSRGSTIAQSGGPRQATFGAQVDVVHVPVTVVDAHGRAVPGLRAEDFTVFEDRQPRAVQVFTAQAIPLSLGVLLDASTSMEGARILDAVDALKYIVRNALAPGDEAFVMTFARAPVVVQGWTEKSALEAMTLDVRVGGGTPMFETLARAIGELSTARHVRRVLLLITDGNATDDPEFFRELRPGDVQQEAPVAPGGVVSAPTQVMPDWPQRARAALRTSEALLYAIGIDSPPQVAIGPAGLPVNARRLQRFTDDTGGYTEIVASSRDLGPAVQRLTNELKMQYLLGYASDKAHDGRFHQIKVEVRCDACRVRARRGFQADRQRR